jgi:hypothetical protein
MPRQNKRSEQGHRIAVVERGLLESAQSFPPPFSGEATNGTGSKS